MEHDNTVSEQELNNEIQKPTKLLKTIYKNDNKHEMGDEEKEVITSAKMTKLRKQLNAESWTENLENLMKIWGEKAAGHRFMHLHAATSWKSLSNKLSFISISITTFASGMSLIASSIDDNEAKNIVLYIVGGLGMISSLIQSLKKLYDAEQKAANHNSIARQFGSFYRYMVLQLNLTREDRQPSDQLSDYVLKEYERLQQEAPLLGKQQIELYKNTFKNSTQANPDICENDLNIPIYRESNCVEVECRRTNNKYKNISEIDSHMELFSTSNSSN